MSSIDVVKIPGTSHFCLAHDRETTRGCLSKGRLDWDRSILDVPEIEGRVRPGRTVIDVGAFIGDTTKIFELSGCRVFAIEPRHDAFRVLSHNCLTSINIHRAAGMPGQRVRESKILSNTHDQNLGGRQMEADESSSQVALALDELNPFACDFIKIDAEGFEPFVLKGAESLIKRTRPVMCVEINGPALRSHHFTGQEIFDLINAWGYGMRPRQAERVGTDHPWDLVCTPG